MSGSGYSRRRGRRRRRLGRRRNGHRPKGRCLASENCSYLASVMLALWCSCIYGEGTKGCGGFTALTEITHVILLVFCHPNDCDRLEGRNTTTHGSALRDQIESESPRVIMVLGFRFSTCLSSCRLILGFDESNQHRSSLNQRDQASKTRRTP